ncbi:MAG: hypothetical protein ACP5RS_02540 [Thermoplasmata archaeon]
MNVREQFPDSLTIKEKLFSLRSFDGNPPGKDMREEMWNGIQIEPILIIIKRLLLMLHIKNKYE